MHIFKSKMTRLELSYTIKALLRQGQQMGKAAQKMKLSIQQQDYMEEFQYEK